MTNENDTETIRYRYVKISLNVKGTQRLNGLYCLSIGQSMIPNFTSEDYRR